MSKYLRRVHREDEGFSLIELLIVIVVLGILGGIVVFGVGTFRADSSEAACNANVQQIKVGAQAYKAKTGSAPANVAALVPAYLETSPSDGRTYTIAAGPPITVTPAPLCNVVP